MTHPRTVPQSPLDLAQMADPSVKKWASSRALSTVFADLLDTDRGRIAITVPAQQGLTTLAKWATIWWLARRPGDHVVIASYSPSVALKNARDLTRAARVVGDEYGFTQSGGRWTASEGGSALFITAGEPLGARPADLFIVDSPVRGAQEARHPDTGRRIWEWWGRDVEPGIAPRGHAVVAMPDWGHPSSDLVRRLADMPRWQYLGVSGEGGRC